MPLKGDLGSIDLAHVFQMLTLNQKAGTLEIVSAGERASIFFTPRGIVYPHDSTAFHDRVLRLLKRRLRLSDEQVARARRLAVTGGPNLLEALVEQAIVPAEEYECAVKEQMEEEIYELFFATEATFEFREGELPDSARETAKQFVLSGDHLVMEAARRIDEWGYIRNIIRDDGDIYEVVGALDDVPKEERDSALLEVLHAVDGVRTVTGIVEVTHLTRYQVCRKLALLSEQGVAAPVPTELLVERGQVCLQGERVRDAIRLFVKAIATGIDEPAVREMTGLAYQAVGEVGQAAAHFAELARSFRDKGDLKGEAEVHLRIRELVPIEVTSRARLLEIYRADSTVLAPFDYEPLAESVELALIYRELGRVEGAIKLVRDMIDSLSASSSASLRLADLAIELGDPKTAVDTLFQTGERLLALRQKDGAVRIFRRVKAIDPYHGGVIERLRELANEEGRRKVRRRRAVMMSTAALVGLVALGGYLEFSRRSWVSYDRIAAKNHLARGQFSEAIESFTELRRAYPFTLWSFLAKERVKDLSVDLKRQERLRAEQVELVRTTVAGRREDAANLLAEARELMRRKELASALPLLRKARATAGDPSWSESEEIDKAISAIEGYFTEARSLRDQGLSLRKQGLWARAHEVLADLARRYPRSPEADGLELPVRVESHPAGARVVVDGRRVLSGRSEVGRDSETAIAVTPVVVDLPASKAVRLSCEKDGYAPGDIDVDALETQSVEVTLRRLPDETVPFDLGAGGAESNGLGRGYRLILDGDHVVLVRDDGRIGVVGLVSREVLWTTVIPDEAGIAAGPCVEAATVWLGTGGGQVLGYAMKDGREVARRDLDRPARGPIIGLAGSLFLASGSHLLGLDAAAGCQVVMDLDLGAAVVAGPRVRPDGLLLALEDQRVVCVSVPGGTVLWESPLGFDVTALADADGAVLAGGARGEIVCLGTTDGAVRWRFRGPEDFAVRLLAGGTGQVLAARNGGGGLFLDLASGTKTAVLDDTVEVRTMAPAAGDRFLVATDHEEVLMMRAGVREPTDIYSLPGRPAGDLLGTSGRVVIVCEGDNLCILRTDPAAPMGE